MIIIVCHQPAIPGDKIFVLLGDLFFLIIKYSKKPNKTNGFERSMDGPNYRSLATSLFLLHENHPGIAAINTEVPTFVIYQKKQLWRCEDEANQEPQTDCQYYLLWINKGEILQ
jgi:hypothetical protein